MAEAKRTLDPYEPYRVAARACGGLSCTPYRLGMAVGAMGADLPSPYPAGSMGERHYRDGVKYGRQNAVRMRPKYEAAIAKATGSAS